MKIIDCFMYYDEDLVLDIRLNILDKYVSYFVICEANFNHNGTKRDLKFDINNFSKFKEKIIYIPLKQQPKNLRIVENHDDRHLKNSKILDNAVLRENFQRNYLQSAIRNFDKDDLIIISDLDEIPNLEKFTYKANLTFFEQKMFFYKFNLVQKDFIWYGSRACKKKHLLNPQWLRNIRSKKYPLWKLNIYFSKKKYNSVNFIKDGGWHFTNIKKPEEIDYKMKNYLHHLEYEESGLNVENIKKIISEKKVLYDHSVDKRGKKWGSSIKLSLEDDRKLPEYIINNKSILSDWID
ncbi:hypothetical protein OAY20_02980 [Candidatus Pelagibacter bacterium]|nr:hypothetical protein [Candidatus Pelagibacter bacterium]